METELEKIAYMCAEVHIKRQRKKRQKVLIIELLRDYANKSTLHGLRYITEKSVSFVEKLFWMATFMISIIFCFILISNVYVKWKTSPIIVTVSEKFMSVGLVPFPSVTICPQIKSKARVYNLTEKIMKQSSMGDEEFEKFSDINLACGSYISLDQRNSDKLITNSSIIAHITDVAPDESDTFFLCVLHLLTVPCEHLFKRVYTSEGLCFNMNGLAADEMFRDSIQSDYSYSARNEPSRGWSIGTGYFSQDDPFPISGGENSAFADLIVTLKTHVNDSDRICNGVNAGFKIYLQHPADIPQSSVYYYAANHGQVTALAVSFQVINTSNTLSGYSPEIRQCYFPQERYLRYFKIYTAKNCRAECLSNYTFALCNCVGYYMPHNSSKQICSENMAFCLSMAHQSMAKEELWLELQGQGQGCHCLPACESIEYNAEVINAEYNGGNSIKILSDLNRWIPGYEIDTEAYKLSKMDIYFKQPRFITMRRSELFGLTDFLANIGGLLGVFLGFSFLSLVEIIYFITLRLGYTLKQDVKK